MKASVERKIIRWLHIILAIPIIGYVYGPLSQFPPGVFMVKLVIFPVLTLSGFWLWKGHVVKRWFRNRG